MSSKLEVVGPSVDALPHKFSDLRELARAIRSRQDEINAQKDDLVARANGIGRNLRLQGLDLLKAKNLVGHGDWLEWLAVHSPATSPRVAQYCMKIANANSSSHFDECDTWAECRALMTSDKTPATKERPWPAKKNIANLKLMDRWLKALATDPLNQCPETIKRLYRQRLQPIAAQLWPEKFSGE